MATFYWNQDNNLVSAEASDLTAAELQAARGVLDIRLICLRGGVQVLLDAGQTVGIVMRDPVNLKEGYVAGPSELTRGTSAADGYVGTTSTDTEFVRDVMHATDGDNAPELLLYQVKAAFYFAGTTGGAPTESQPFSLTITPSYYRIDLPPAEIIQTYPSASQLTAAILYSSGKEPGLGNPAANGMALFSNTSGTRYWGNIPTTFPTLTATGSVTAATFSGSGVDLTDLPAGSLDGAVAIDNGGTGATTPEAALLALGGAPTDSPAFTGTVTIPAGASIAGYAPLASPTFTGTVTIPAGASIAGYAPLASPTFTGTPVIPGYAKTNNSGSGVTFIGSVTVSAGHFIGDGSGLTNVAPYHFGNGFSMPTLTEGVLTSGAGNTFSGSDVRGSIGFSSIANGSNTLFTVVFGISYSTTPCTPVLVPRNIVSATNVQWWVSSLSTSGFTISGTVTGSGINYAWDYYIPQTQ